MKRRVLTIDQFVSEDARIDNELDSLVELAVLESENTEDYRTTYKTILFESFGVNKTEDLTFDQKNKYLQLVKEAIEVSGESLNESLNEGDLSLKEEYAKYFSETLEGMGVKSIKELDGTTKSEFFKKLREGWIKGQGRKDVSEEANEGAILEADIKDAEGFKKFAEAKLKKMHGDDYDEAKAKKVIDGLSKDAEESGDWGAAIGKLNKG